MFDKSKSEYASFPLKSTKEVTPIFQRSVANEIPILGICFKSFIDFTLFSITIPLVYKFLLKNRQGL